MITQEVYSQVRPNENKLRELVDHLDPDFNYESAIQKLQARLKMQLKGIDAAGAYMTNTQDACPQHTSSDFTVDTPSKEHSEKN